MHQSDPAAEPLMLGRVPSLWGDSARPRTAAEWDYRRKGELFELFASQIYGRTPDGGGIADIGLIGSDEVACDGLGTRSQLLLTLRGPLGARTARLLLYTPIGASRAAPAPVFVGLNFMGNHSTAADPAIAVSPGYPSSTGWETGAAERGSQLRRWPVQLALQRGYAVATMHYADLEGDRPGLAFAGVRGLFDSEAELAAPAPDAWAAIGAWAWGLSRLLDALATRPEIDAAAAIVHGHSRLGKTALWAAAQDPRFAAAISNDSGCGGAALFRHAAGETVAMITRDFPHWFAGNFNAYRDDPARLPVDQHQLLALLAPRPVHVASATLDAHADPRGEFLSTLHASPVFELFGHRGTRPAEMARAGEDLSYRDVPTPGPGPRIGGRLSYHMRQGVHDVLAEDWRHFLDFADANVRSRQGIYP